MHNQSSRRLFFALWPGLFIQQKIFSAFTRTTAFHQTQNPTQQQKQQRLPRIYQVDNLHMTLHFLGNVSWLDMECIDKLASCITARPFTLNLNCYGCFHEARVFWMGSDEPSENLFYLHTMLAESIQDCSLQLDDRPYTPHITLLRYVTELSSVINSETIRWDVKQFALVESVSTPQGVNYTPIKFYDLTAA